MERSQEKTTLMAGWMLKSPPFATESSRIFFLKIKTLRPSWKRRYFVLYRLEACSPAQQDSSSSNYCLMYYKSSKRLGKPHGSVDLTMAKNIVTDVIPPPLVVEDIPKRLLVGPPNELPFFQLETQHKAHDRTYYLLPDSRVQMEAWVDHISRICGLCEEEEQQPDVQSDAEWPSMPSLMPLQPAVAPLLLVSSCPQQELSEQLQQQQQQQQTYDQPPLPPRPVRGLENEYNQPTDKVAHAKAGNDSDSDNSVYKVPPSAQRPASAVSDDSAYGVPPNARNVSAVSDDSAYGVPPNARNVSAVSDDSAYGVPPNARAGTNSGVSIDSACGLQQVCEIACDQLCEQSAMKHNEQHLQPPKPAPRSVRRHNAEGAAQPQQYLNLPGASSATRAAASASLPVPSSGERPTAMISTGPARRSGLSRVFTQRGASDSAATAGPAATVATAAPAATAATAAADTAAAFPPVPAPRRKKPSECDSSTVTAAAVCTTSSCSDSGSSLSDCEIPPSKFALN